MSILVDEHTRVLVQGFGRAGQFHAEQCMKYGTKVVGAVRPGKGGEEVIGVPLFNTVREAMSAVEPNASIVFVPAPGAADAVMEAAEAGIELVVAITEGIPARDMVRTAAYLRDRSTRLIGPNCPGIISPGEMQAGDHAGAYPSARSCRRGFAVGNTDLRSGRAVKRAGHWAVELRRHRRRPDYRDVVHRRLGAVQCRPETHGIIMIGESAGPPKRKRRRLSKRTSRSRWRHLLRVGRLLRVVAWDMPGRLFPGVKARRPRRSRRSRRPVSPWPRRRRRWRLRWRGCCRFVPGRPGDLPHRGLQPYE